MAWGMPVDLALACGELWCPNFGQVLGYCILKGVVHCLKPLKFLQIKS